jgi:biopolymer transport protein TolR
MSMMLREGKHLGSEMNVTPLIDVLLVLLIIFMVLVHNRGEQVEIPQPSPIQVSGPEPVVVLQLTDAGEGRSPAVTIDRKEVAWDKLDSSLREIYEKRKEKAVYLKGDPGIDFQYVAEAVDIAHHAGVDRVGLMGHERP